MSCHKIKRLKTPVKTPQQLKGGGSTLLTRGPGGEESVLSAIRASACSQSVQQALMEEINSVYRQIASVRQQSKRYQLQSWNLGREKQELEQLVGQLSQDIKYFKEVYELEITNHQQLRKFYELREQEWRFIVEQHRQLLELYDQQHNTNYSQIQQSQTTPNSPTTPRNSPITHSQIHQSQVPHSRIGNSSPSQVQGTSQHSESVYSSKAPEEPGESRVSSRRSKLSSDKRSSSQPRLKLSRGREDDFLREMSRLYIEESKFTKKASEQLLCLQQEQLRAKGSLRSAQADDFCDDVIRRTYCRFREQCISVAQIEGLPDMLKLKNANTSTRQRLAKTLRKLHFQLENDQELRLFCDYLEKTVLQRNKALRGDLVAELLLDKLRDCEKLAVSSNSELSRFQKERTELRLESQHQGSPSQTLGKSSRNCSEIDRDPRTIELQLDSMIKTSTSVKQRSGEQGDGKGRLRGDGSSFCVSDPSQLPSQSFEKGISFRGWRRGRRSGENPELSCLQS